MSQENVKENGEEAPFHVLMASERPTQELLVRNDAVKNDYLSRRFKTLHKGEAQENIWSAALPSERALIECCQLSGEGQVGGALAKGKEREFVRLVALHCHTAATRGLALAILEKTIQQDKIDAPEEEEEEEEGTVMQEEGMNEDAFTQNVTVKSEEEHDDGDRKLPATVKKEDEPDNSENENGRVARFLELGGLTILKQWLMDAMTPVKTYVIQPNETPSNTSGTASTKQTTRVVQTTASPTGPLLLPLLQILTDMPFIKQLVIASKINKQIRRLNKQVEEAISVRRSVRKDDKQWTDPVAGGLIVEDVKTALALLMKTWEERNKSKSLVTTDPFQALKEKMKEACQVLKEYEVGGIEKPDFLEEFEKEQRRIKEEEQVSKLTVEQRAARERQQEKEAMLKMAQQRQSEAKAKMDLLLQKSRQESLKRKAEGMVAEVIKKRTARRVRWKDGLENADNMRRRNLLEQVHVYSREPDLDEYDEAVKQEGQEEGTVKQDPEEDDGIPYADDSEGPVKQEPE